MFASAIEANNVNSSTIATQFANILTLTAGSVTIDANGIVSRLPVGFSALTVSTLNVSSIVRSKSVSTLQGNFSSININCTNPAYNLDVCGTAHVSGNVLFDTNLGIGMTPSYPLDVSGTVRVSTDIILTSDRRIKENIVKIDSALDKVNSIRGVYYNLISTLSTARKIGFIAQEIEEILPEVVHTDSTEDKMKSVSYGNITALLIEGMKELHAKVERIEYTQKQLIQQVSTLMSFKR